MWLIIHLLMWILQDHPLPQGWSNELWWRRGLSVRLPNLPLAFSQNALSIFLPFLMSEWCWNELLLSESPVFMVLSEEPLLYAGGGDKIHFGRFITTYNCIIRLFVFEYSRDWWFIPKSVCLVGYIWHQPSTLGVGTHMSVWLAYICKTVPHGHLMRRSISKQ